jgi:DNA-binding LacI/PurR family transcriptional regulator
MAGPATIRDVAREADVSLKTVSNVLNGTATVADLTRARVERAVAKLGYRPNLAARYLRSGRSRAVALAVPDLGRPYFAEMADHVLAAARDQRFSVLIEQTVGEERLEVEAVNSPRFRHTQGLVLALESIRPGQTDRLRHEVAVGGRRLVILGASVNISGVSSLHQPDEVGAFAATEYLINIGCRSIAAIGGIDGDEIGPGARREAGFLRALRTYGLPVARAPRVLTRDGTFAAGEAAVIALLDSGVPFDAVFAFSDVLALGVLAGLRKAGVLVPSQVSVIGFDNLDHSAYTSPALSTVDTHLQALAERAVQLIAAGEADGGVGPEHGELGFSLIHRGTTRG